MVWVHLESIGELQWCGYIWRVLVNLNGVVHLETIDEPQWCGYIWRVLVNLNGMGTFGEYW